MSYEVTFWAWRSDGTMEEHLNPFTREKYEARRRTISESEVAAVTEVLRYAQLSRRARSRASSPLLRTAVRSD